MTLACSLRLSEHVRERRVTQDYRRLSHRAELKDFTILLAIAYLHLTARVAAAELTVSKNSFARKHQQTLKHLRVDEIV